MAGARGHEMTPEDQLRARAIEMLMCDFRLDRAELRLRFADLACGLDADLGRIAARFGDLVRLDETALEILPDGRALTRIMASCLDAHQPEGVRYSRAS